MYILALADDMTGALEIGAKFSAAGIHTLVSAQPIPARSAQVIVFDTETRHVPAKVARSEVRRFIQQSSGAGQPRLIYKKTDSTLRGNISAELQAVAELYPAWRIGYAPAYPALGRTVKAGVLHVHGIPVSETEFARDALNPIRTSAISAILHPELPCTIFDGDTQEHLDETAQTMLRSKSMRIMAGPAGLAETIASRIHCSRTAIPALPAITTCLVLNGSRHERSAKQMHHAEAPGWRALRKDFAPDASAPYVAIENAKYLVDAILAEEPDAALVIGGDTAFAVVQALGFPPLLPIAEVVPGVPVTRIEAALLGRKRDLFLITKAGGFGDRDVLLQVRSKLSRSEGNHPT